MVFYSTLYRRIAIFFALCIFPLLLSCGKPPFDKVYHLVTNIVDGNTIELDNNIQVGLLGINKSPSSETYLQTNLLNQQVRFAFDSYKRDPVTGPNAKIYGYILTVKQLSVNGDILKQGLSTLNEAYLKDSLQVFRTYTGNNDEESGDGDNDVSPTVPPASGATFVELIKSVESAVFTIYKKNYSGELTGLGTGFFISPDGIGVSNYHVFEGGSDFHIKTFDQTEFSVAQIISENEQYDYIIFKIAADVQNLSYLALNQELPLKGEEVFVIGNPSGLESTATKGIVSAVRTRYSTSDLIQIDAAISPGSSGSPVFNMAGKVIGIATFKIMVEGCELCNFAINIDLIINALNDNSAH